MKEVIQINTCGLDFIVFRDEISSIIKDQIIHHLPLSEKSVAGISEIDDRVLTFLDFSVSIGLQDTFGKREKHLIMLSESDIAGFAVSGNIEESAVSENEIVQVHPFIKNQIIDKIVIKNRNLIPVINIKNLYDYIEQNYLPFEFTPTAEYNSGLEVNKSDSPYIVNCGPDTFALFSGQSDYVPEKISNIVPLSILPSYISGVSLFEDDILLLFDTCLGIRSGINSKAGFTLPLDIKGKIGFTFDSLKYDNRINPEQIFSLPPLVQTKYMHYALKYDNSIICVVEPENLFASISDKSEELDLNEKYSPDSQIHLNKQKEPVSVIEILFSEAVHSVPESEVDDIFPLTEYFEVPKSKSIVAGIAEYDGELLPVIDPAACYGLRSSPDDDWKMLLIKNGNFRCLLLTEKVYTTKTIQVRDQRELPVKLDHNFVYICYPDIETDNIKLVLNIEAIAVYFKDSMAAEISKLFLRGKIREIPKATLSDATGEVSDKIEEKEEVEVHTDEELIFEKDSPGESAENYIEIMEPEKEESTEPDEAEFHEEHVLETDQAENEDSGEAESAEHEDDELKAANIDEIESYENEETEQNENVGPEESGLSDTDSTQEEDELEHEYTQEQSIEIDDYDSEEAEVQDSISSDQEDTSEIEDNILEEYEFTENESVESDNAEEVAEESNETEFNAGEYLKLSENLDEEDIEFVPIEEDEAQESVTESTTFINDEDNDADIKSEEKETADQEHETEITHDKIDNKDNIETSSDIIEAESVDTHFSDDGKQKTGKSVTQILSSGNSRLPGKVRRYFKREKKYKLIIDFIFIIITILVLLFIIFGSRTRFFKRSQNNIKIDKSDTEIENTDNEINDENRLEEPVQQNLPINEKKDPTEFIYKSYNVKKGDTLYEITEEFTGDGFDYPEVARDNDIPDPDLIFPKQTIKIKVRKKSQK